MRLEQSSIDGNHRTSTLVLYEYFRMFGLQVNADPLDVYLLLSCAEDLGAAEEIRVLTGFLRKRVQHGEISTDYVPRQYQGTPGAGNPSLPDCGSFGNPTGRHEKTTGGVPAPEAGEPMDG